MESVGAILKVSPQAQASDAGKTKCEHCGQTLYFSSVFLGGKVFWLKDPERCNCSRAAEYWQAYDVEQERQELAKEEAEARQRKQERIDRLIGSSGLKKRFQKRTFENFQVSATNRRAYMTAKGYADDFPANALEGKGLFFEGPFGTGKTHLAAAIAIQLMNGGIPCIFKTSIDLLEDIRRTFANNGGITEQQVLKVYKDVDLLIIDDLGKEMCTEWAVTTLYAVLNDRYEAMRPTIITTNYNDSDLIARLKHKELDSASMGAILSRLKETSVLVSMNWQDWRIDI